MRMRPANHIEIVTPRKFVLDGLWLGPKKPKKAIVWVHGLGSSMFRKLAIMDHLVNKDTAVLTFNNRGHDKVTRGWTLTGKTVRVGASHEVFTDSADDIEGAVRFAKSMGAKEIYVVGHSTGCQKSAYWAGKGGKGASGIILLSPISDYSAEMKSQGKVALKRAEKVAREFIRKGKGHEMLPEQIWAWPWIADAQRFISLYSGNSAEEIFTYWDPTRRARTLRSIKKPMLIILAKNEEYTDRPIAEIAEWFETQLKSSDKVKVLPRTGHSFHGSEGKVAKEIRAFMKEC